MTSFPVRLPESKQALTGLDEQLNPVALKRDINEATRRLTGHLASGADPRSVDPAMSATDARAVRSRR